MKLRTQLVSALIFSLSVPSFSLASLPITEKINVDGAMRIRYEDANKSFFQNSSHRMSTVMRSMLGFTLSPNDGLDIRFKFKDSRILGTTYTNSSSPNKIELQEGYILSHNPAGLPLDAQFGRFEMMYGRRRVLGNGNWSNYGPRTYDGFRLTMDISAGQLDFFGTQLTESTYLGLYDLSQRTRQDAYLFGLAGSFFSGMIQPLVYHFQDNDKTVLGSDTYPIGTQTTVAVYSPLRFGHVEINNDLAIQFGENSFEANFYPEARKDQFGWLIASEATFAPPLPNDPRFTLGLDITSGTTPREYYDGTVHGFYAPFMSRHFYRGYMDYFADETYGLGDYYVKFGTSPTPATSLEATLHYFSRTVDNSENDLPPGEGIYYPNHAMTLGTELDVCFRVEISEGLDFQMLFGTFFANEDWHSDAEPRTLSALTLIGYF